MAIDHRLTALALLAALALAGCSNGAPAPAAHQAVDPTRQFDLQCTDVLRRIGRRFTFTLDLTTGQWRDSTGTMHRIVSTAANAVVLSEAPDGTRPTINLQTNTLLMGGNQPTTVAATCRRMPFTPLDEGS